MPDTPPVPAELGRYEAAYRSGVKLPWDLDGPTPFVVDVERQGLVSGEVLDTGCGTGENVLYLAGRGYRVTGVDCSPTALERARAKAVQRGVSVALEEGDACVLAGYEGRFRTVVDSGLFHNLTEHDQTRYVAALHRSCRAGALAHVFCMSDDRGNWGDVPWEPSCGRQGISTGHLLGAFAEGWRTRSLIDLPMPVDVPGVGVRVRMFRLLTAQRV